MALDASDFPMEGPNFNLDSLPPVDFLIHNIGAVQRSIGAKRPEYVPDVGAMANGNIPQPIIENNGMPNQDIVPDMPKSLKLPDAKMMPGANTEPGKAITDEDRKEIQIRMQKAAEQNAMIMKQMQQMQRNQQYHAPIVNKPSDEITYFKDSSGNQYKTIGEKLYVLGWQDADIKIRLVSDKTNKEVPTSGKRFQIYGWHLVKKVTESNEIEKVSTADDVDSKLETVRVDEERKGTASKPEEVKVEPDKAKTPKKKNGKRLI